MRIVSLVLLSLLSFSSYSQGTQYHTADKRALKYYEEARQYLKRSQFREAMEPLQDALDKDPNFIEGWLAMGSANYRLRRDSMMMVCFNKALEIDPDYKKSIYAYYLIGEVYFKNANYQKAIDYLGHYLSREDIDAKQADKSREMVSSCDFAIHAVANPFEYNIKVLPDSANSFALQYFPALSVDQKQLFFTRRTGFSIHDDEDIYYSEWKEDSTWSRPRSISPNINTEFNEGAASLSADGRMLVFTSCDGRRGFGSCDLYVSYKEGSNWSVPINMGPMINTTAWEAQPSLSSDGRTIYFVSNRGGGKGKKDLWAAKKNRKGKWEPAYNLGNKINTNKDDISPFIHVNGETLYFSSTGREGLGGMDIYKSELKDATWSEPLNLGYPLNDAHDQVSLYISSDAETGCYTIEKSTRNQFESKLYSFDLPDTFQVTSKSSFLAGTVSDAETNKPLAASIKLYKLNDEKYFSQLASDKVTGDYTLVLTENNRYGIYIVSKGYMFQDFSFSLDELEGFDENILDIKLEPIKVGATTIMGNIFFGFDEYTLKKESMSELKTAYDFLRKNPDIKVEISGHTDNTGTVAYNLELSTKRAKSVYDFLIFKRISKDQIIYKGYGQTSPIATNDNLEGQSQNRRIEFKILQASK